MCEAFARAGHETTLIGRPSERGGQDDPYDFYGVERNFELDLIARPRIKGTSILALPKLHARLQRYDPKHVLIYARDIYGVSLAARTGFRAIYEIHAPPYNRLIRLLESRLLRGPRLVRFVVISKALGDLYASKFDVADRMVVCHDAAGVPNPSVRGDLPWPPCRDTLQVGYTGHLHPGRGIEVIVECARRLGRYDFHVIGGDDKDILHWRRRAPANLNFHGFVAPSMVASARAKCDVLLMPYQKEIINPRSKGNTVPWMSPMKLFEYMASRKTIVASDLPVLREVLDEQMAVLVPHDDIDRWEHAIGRCEDPAYRPSLADNAYNAFLERYTWDKRVRDVLDDVPWRATG